MVYFKITTWLWVWIFKKSSSQEIHLSVSAVLSAGYTLSFASPLSSCVPPFCPITSDVSRHAHCELCPSPEHGKAGQMVAREVARADQCASVCVCVCIQYLKATLHRWTMAVPAHTGPWVVAPSRDPIIPVPLRGCDLETRADCDNSLAERQGGHLVCVATS